MARRTLAALLALALIVTPAHAQTGQPGRVLLDMTIQALPGIPSGHCLYVDAGRFLVEARLIGENPWPVRFILGPALDVPPSLELQAKTPELTTGTVQVEAGVYCYTLVNDASAEAPPLPDQASKWEQLIAVRLIWLPAP
jgi:hypothetical protein